MRAYIRGCAAHEHQNNCNPEEYEFYKKNILMAKEYGFNTIRFHSVVPAEACFRAADELGILIHIEMRKDKMDYDNLKEMLYGKNDFVSDAELLEMIAETDGNKIRRGIQKIQCGKHAGYGYRVLRAE